MSEMNPLVFVAFHERSLNSIRSVVVPCGRPISSGSDIAMLKILAQERAKPLGWHLDDIAFWRRLENEDE